VITVTTFLGRFQLRKAEKAGRELRTDKAGPELGSKVGCELGAIGGGKALLILLRGCGATEVAPFQSLPPSGD
jgi:hypothetical protein